MNKTNCVIRMAVKRSIDVLLPTVGRYDLYELFKFVFLTMNCRIEYIKALNWPQHYEDIALQNMIYTHRADILISKIVADHYFLGTFKITTSFDTTSTAILSLTGYSKAEPSISAMITMRPLAYLAIFITSLVVTTYLVSLHVLRRPKASFWSQIKTYLWITFSDILLKPKIRLPTSSMDRLLHLLWVVPVWFFVTWYNANLQTKYIFQTGDKINCMDDLLSRPHIKIIISITSPSISPFAELLRVERYKKLRKQIQVLNQTEYRSFETKGVLGRRTSIQNLVIIDTINNLRVLTLYNRNETKWNFSKNHYFRQSLVLAVNSNISEALMNSINVKISRFVETDQLTRVKRKENLIFYTFPPSDDDANVKWQSLKVLDVVWFLVLYAVGASFALLTFLVIKCVSIFQQPQVWAVYRKSIQIGPSPISM